jgi:anti-sigma B factor antagonist
VSVVVKAAEADTELSVQGELTIYRAGELAGELLAAACNATVALRIDLSGVTEIDTAGLQILLMLRRTAVARGVRLELVRPSACVQEVFELCRQQPLLGEAAPR